MKPKLLTRDEFREGTFKRDNHKCVVCGEVAQDAHHIIERRLWGDSSGYYLDNGASLCGKHHLDAERTVLSCDELRDLCGIENTILPEHLYRDNTYDKWGNIILPNNMRTKGELFHDDSVQKIIAPVLDVFTDYVKYPRTYHLPQSASKTNDDRTLNNCDHFIGKEVVVTEKLDGENSTIYPNYYHARSLESEYHESRTWVKNLAANIGWEFPDGWRLCGENLFAKHAIAYDNLESYFYAFSVWDDKNVCQSWDDTVDFADILGIPTVPVIWRGIWCEKKIHDIIERLDTNKQEGFVVRVVDAFTYGAFKHSIAKYVRKNHVADNVHNWKMQRVIPNKLKEI